MALEVWFASEVQRGIASGLALLLDTASASDSPNADFVRGAVAMARAQCLQYGLDWADVVEAAKAPALASVGKKNAGALPEPAPAFLAHLCIQQKGGNYYTELLSGKE